MNDEWDNLERRAVMQFAEDGCGNSVRIRDENKDRMAQFSIAISLKRIADALEKKDG